MRAIAIPVTAELPGVQDPGGIPVQAYYIVVKPDGGADWTLRLQATLLFPAK